MGNLKTIISWPVLVCLSLLTIWQLKAVAQTEAVFKDVDSQNPNFIAISYLQDHGIVQGHPDGFFRSEEKVNRAEALKIILLSANYHFAETNPTETAEPINVNIPTENIEPIDVISATPSADIFSDVKSTDWFFNFIKKSVELGIIAGYPDGSFHPEKTVNLAESLKMISLSNQIKIEEVSLDPFNDVPQNAWFAGYIEYFKKYELLVPDNQGNIYPDTNLTRGELARIIYGFIKKDDQPLVFQAHGQEPEYIYVKATFYGAGDGFDGRGTASGTIFDKNQPTAAHRTLPFGTKIRVISIENNNFVDVEITDRGPYDYRFDLDLASSAFEKLAPISRGYISVKYYIINDQTLDP